MTMAQYRRLGLLAGAGQLPVRLAEFSEKEGRLGFVLRFSGLAETGLARFPGETVAFGEVGRQISLLKRADCDTLCLAGVVPRPDFTSLKLDWKAVTLMPRILAAARKGDDALLRVLVAVFEEEGFKVIGADDVLAQLLAPVGVIAGPRPSEQAISDLAKAWQAAKLIGSIDAGQGAVVADGLVLALEAQEGTDKMLERVGQLPEAVRGRWDARRGVLVKCPKPIQERRVDLPVIGTTTLERASSAGLAGIGIAAGAALILDRKGVEELATSLGMFVVGLDEAGQF